MSEDEIIKYIKDEIENETDTYHWFDDNPENKTRKQIEESINAHQGLLDLYNKEKEKNKKIFIQYEKRVNELEREIAINSISKDKIRDKIKELEKEYEEYKDSQEWEIFDETKYAYELLQELLEERN